MCVCFCCLFVVVVVLFLLLFLFFVLFGLVQFVVVIFHHLVDIKSNGA